MKTKLLFSLLLLCLLYTPVFLSAQTLHCAYTDAMNAQEQRHPGFKAAADKVFKEMKKQAHNSTRSGQIYRIKVVFHALNKDAGQYLDDSVFYNQIAIMNADYRRMNADTVNTRLVFKPVAGDASIEFELASIDPQGNPTTGIHRVQSNTNFAFAPFNDNVKYTAQGGTDAWDVRHYLNIWVCDMSIPGIGPAVLGYAYPPNNLPNWPANSGTTDSLAEGVVIHYQAVGSNNPLIGVLDNTVDRGRTATHEVGHFLGLRHVWGDGDCTMDDGISDTPDADDNAGQQCDWTKNTCTESTGAQFPDMIENFMDYAADSCMNMFTNEQIGIMRAVLEGPRIDLVAWSVANEEAILSAQIKLYPNPTNKAFTLSFENRAASSFRVSFSNTLGQKVLPDLESTNLHFQQSFSVSTLPKGIYFVSIFTENQLIVKRLLVE